MVQKFSGEGLLYEKLVQLDQKLHKVAMQIVVMSARYDKRLEMFFGKNQQNDRF